MEDQATLNEEVLKTIGTIMLALEDLNKRLKKIEGDDLSSK